MRDMKRKKSCFGFGIAAILLFVLCGCINKTGSTAVPLDGTVDDFAPLTTSAMNYEDIELPVEMKYSRKDSVTIRTDSFRGGISYYKGRVEIYSLKDFVVSSMKKNKWKLAGEVSSANVVLAFTKPNKTCMMKIESNGALSDTTLTMYLTVDVNASRTLNAFGEPIE